MIELVKLSASGKSKIGGGNSTIGGTTLTGGGFGGDKALVNILNDVKVQMKEPKNNNVRVWTEPLRDPVVEECSYGDQLAKAASQGGCPHPCPDDMPPPVFDFESLERGGGGNTKPVSRGGWFVGVAYNIALAGGFGFEIGVVGDEDGGLSTYFSASGLIGIGADISLVGGTISSTTSTGFVSENFSGTSSSYNVSFSTPIGGAGYETGGSIDRSLSARDKMSPSKFGNTTDGYKTNTGGYSLTRTGYGAGAYYSYSGTLTSKIK